MLKRRRQIGANAHHCNIGTPIADAPIIQTSPLHPSKILTKTLKAMDNQWLTPRILYAHAN